MAFLPRVGLHALTLLLLAFPVSAQVGAVLSERKITAGLSGFIGPVHQGDRFGAAIAPLGDLDGNGHIDIAVGAPGAGGDHGAVWILFLDGTGRVVSQRKIAAGLAGFGGALDTGDHFGQGLAAIGDLDGDGRTELAVGAPGGGDVWVLFLNADGTVASWRRIGASEAVAFGTALAPIGDVDSDGIPDLAIGAPVSGGGTVGGAVWLAFLNPDGTPKGMQKIARGVGGFDGPLDFGDSFGYALAHVGDLDGDGRAELAVGAVGDDDGGDGQGAVWILFLGPGGAVHGTAKISAAAGAFGGGLEPFDHFGSALAPAGDLDGDGTLDLAVGAYNVQDGGDGSGAVWLLLLRPDGSVRAERKIGQATPGVQLSGAFAFGSGLAFLGDLDGDGFSDVAVGAPSYTHLDTAPGAVWLLFLDGPHELPGDADPIPTGEGVGRVGPRLFVVDDDDVPGVFSNDVQDAVDRARTGDVILVQPGHYGPVEITGRSATLIAPGGPGTTSLSRITVTALAPQHSVVVRGVRSTFDLFDNAGSVWLEDCRLPSTTIQACADVGFSRTTVRGFSESSGFCPNGGTALLVVDSTLYAYDSAIEGSNGCDAWINDIYCESGICSLEPATIGAVALELAGGARAFLVRTTVQGGDGGDGAIYADDCVWCPSDADGTFGGHGALLPAGTELVTLESPIRAGAGSPPGTAVLGAGTRTALPGHTCDYEVDVPVVRGTPARLEFTGRPGSRAFLTYADEIAPEHVPQFNGWSVVDPGSPSVFLGTLPASGVLQVDVPFELLVERQQAAVLFTQAKLYDPVTGVGALGAPSVLLQVRRTP